MIIKPKFSEFSKHIEQLCPAGQDKLRGQLSRFKARYRLALNLTAIQAQGYKKPETIAGYSAGLGLMLAHNALDHLYKALGKKLHSGSVTIDNPALAIALREQLNKIQDDHDEHFDHDGFRNVFQSFMRGETNNLFIPANALRIMFAHGSYTVSATRTTTKKHLNNLYQLRVLVLNRAAQTFNDWIEQKLAGVSDLPASDRVA